MRGSKLRTTQWIHTNIDGDCQLSGTQPSPTVFHHSKRPTAFLHEWDFQWDFFSVVHCPWPARTSDLDHVETNRRWCATLAPLQHQAQIMRIFSSGSKCGRWAFHMNIQWIIIEINNVKHSIGSIMFVSAYSITNAAFYDTDFPSMLLFSWYSHLAI